MQIIDQAMNFNEGMVKPVELSRETEVIKEKTINVIRHLNISATVMFDSKLNHCFFELSFYKLIDLSLTFY